MIAPETHKNISARLDHSGFFHSSSQRATIMNALRVPKQTNHSSIVDSAPAQSALLLALLSAAGGPHGGAPIQGGDCRRCSRGGRCAGRPTVLAAAVQHVRQVPRQPPQQLGAAGGSVRRHHVGRQRTAPACLFNVFGAYLTVCCVCFCTPLSDAAVVRKTLRAVELNPCPS